MTKTILLADDDASVRTMIGRVLELERYRVIFASTGSEAASRFLSASGPPDLVLLDLNMPEKTAGRPGSSWERCILSCG